MTLEEAVQTLEHHESFATFITNIHQLREESIAELHKANYEDLNQVSGKILAYDQILQLSNFENIQRRFG
tara:strand:+ start:6169 stop:6378 length:210 start_codon:yes stop_codon:yes gene_type:complete